MVEYKKGCENKVVDALSRRSDPACEASVSSSVSASHPTLFFISFPCPSWIEELKDSYKQNPKLQQLLQQFKSGSNYLRLFSLHNDLILYKGRVFLGTQCSLKSKILHLVHDSPLGGNSGFLKSFHRLKQDFFWVGMRSDLKQHIKECGVPTNEE